MWAVDPWASIPGLLLCADASIHCQDDEGNTPHYAAAQGHLDAVRLLCSRGADPDTRNGQQQTALFVASCLKRTEVRNYLLDETLAREPEIARFEGRSSGGRRMLRGSSPTLCPLRAAAASSTWKSRHENKHDNALAAVAFCQCTVQYSTVFL